MKKYLVLGLGAAGAAAASVAVFGTGVASAINEYAGQTYADASQAISDAGQSATIATRVAASCRRTSASSPDLAAPTSSTPAAPTGNRVLLYLNCNNTFATAGVPGNSIGSPEGRAARADYEEKQAQAQAEAQQSESTELEQTGNVPGEAGQVAGG